VRDLHAELVGRLQIGVLDKTATNPEACLAQAIRLFRQQAPAVELEITVGSLHSIERGVIDGSLQLGVLPDHRRSDSLDYHPLFNETMLLYCGGQHPLFAADLSQLSLHQLQTHDYAGLGYHSQNMEASHRFGLRRTASATDQEAVATLILSGCYIGFLPDHYAATFAPGVLRSLTLAPAEQVELSYVSPFAAIVRHAPQPGRVGQSFLQALLQAHGA
jgi:DNA-binding transcriptional LysR family regulator